MTGALFDEPSRFDEMLSRGLRLSGESRSYFREGRLARLRALLPEHFSPEQVLDFGCGTGETAVRLAEWLGSHRVVGLDVSPGALEHARAHHGSDTVTFHHFDTFPASAVFDLCYSNGVFHHIPPAGRQVVLRRLWALLRPGGLLAVFENNPWNPGTRLVMRRVPFDRDARVVAPGRMKRLLLAAGFEVAAPVRHLFVFPRPLRALRFTERRLERLPLGGQYLVLGRRPPA